MAQSHYARMREVWELREPAMEPDLCDQNSLTGLGPPPEDQAFCYRRINGSALVFQAGRLFLIRPTTAVVDRILGSDLVPSHVVLTSWATADMSGLDKLEAKIKATGKCLTIWTSDWIWEELLRSGTRLPPTSG